MDQVTAGCLVRALPVGGDSDSCAHCRGGRMTGTPGVPNDLQQAQRTADLRAAALVAEGDQGVFDEMLDYVGLPAPTDEEIGTVGLTAYRDPSAQLTGPDAVTVSSLLHLLVRREIPAIGWLHVGPDGLELYLSEIGAGRPLVTPRVQAWRWADLAIPGLPADPQRLRFHLAGGAGPASPAQTAAAVREQLPTRLPVPADSVLVVVNGSRRWPLLDRVAHDAGWRLGAAALLQCPNSDPAVLIEHLTRQAPLADPIDLVLVDVAADGHPIPVQQPVFDGQIGGSDTAQVAIYVPFSDDPFVTLPFVTRGKGSSIGAPVRIVRVRLPRGEAVTLQVALDDAGGITLPDVPDVVNESRELAHLLAPPAQRSEMPTHDLVIAVENVDVVANRSAKEEVVPSHAATCLLRVQQLVWAIAREVGSSVAVRVGAIRYDQHKHRNHRPWSAQPLGHPAATQAEVGQWHLEPNENDLAAALEEALVAAAAQDWRDDVPCTLVVFGSRPPYPQDNENDDATACQAHLRWEDGLAGLQPRVMRVALRYAVSLSAPAGRSRHRGDQAWQSLGRDMLADPQSIDNNTLMGMIGLRFAGNTTSLAYPIQRPVTSPAPLRRIS